MPLVAIRPLPCKMALVPSGRYRTLKISGTTSTVRSSLQFMVREARHLEEKPYALEYDVPGSDIPRRNFVTALVEDVEVHDIRPVKESLSLDREGIAVAETPTKMAYENFYDETKVTEVFAEELRRHLLDYLQAKRVYFYEFLVRSCVDDSVEETSTSPRAIQDSKARSKLPPARYTEVRIWPANTSGTRRPVSSGAMQDLLLTTSADFTLDAIKTFARDALGPESEALLKGRFQALKFVRPSAAAQALQPYTGRD